MQAENLSLGKKAVYFHSSVTCSSLDQAVQRQGPKSLLLCTQRCTHYVIQKQVERTWCEK